VAVLVSLHQWQRHVQGSSNNATAAKDQERRVRAYQKRMQQLGPDYWLSSDQQTRLKELVEKEDSDTALIPAERKEMRQLLKRHQQLMVKRAAAMHALR
jgi:Spy/CpxP family protein refolding chaperone